MDEIDAFLRYPKTHGEVDGGRTAVLQDHSFLEYAGNR